MQLYSVTSGLWPGVACSSWTAGTVTSARLKLTSSRLATNYCFLYLSNRKCCWRKQRKRGENSNDSRVSAWLMCLECRNGRSSTVFSIISDQESICTFTHFLNQLNTRHRCNFKVSQFFTGSFRNLQITVLLSYFYIFEVVLCSVLGRFEYSFVITSYYYYY